MGRCFESVNNILQLKLESVVRIILAIKRRKVCGCIHVLLYFSFVSVYLIGIPNLKWVDSVQFHFFGSNLIFFLDLSFRQQFDYLLNKRSFGLNIFRQQFKCSNCSSNSYLFVAKQMVWPLLSIFKHPKDSILYFDVVFSRIAAVKEIGTVLKILKIPIITT